MGIVDNNKRVNLFLDPEILKQAKMRAVAEGVSLSSLVDKAILNYIAGNHIDIDSIPATPNEEGKFGQIIAKK